MQCTQPSSLARCLHSIISDSSVLRERTDLALVCILRTKEGHSPSISGGTAGSLVIADNKSIAARMSFYVCVENVNVRKVKIIWYHRVN